MTFNQKVSLQGQSFLRFSKIQNVLLAFVASEIPPPSLGAPEFLYPSSTLIPSAVSDQECVAGNSPHLQDEAGRRSHSKSSRTVTHSHPLWPSKWAPQTEAFSVPRRDKHKIFALSIHLTDSRCTSTPLTQIGPQVFGTRI